MRPAFTLMELLIVIGILGILALTVLTAINPLKQMNDARNAFRMNAIVQIENAAYQYVIDGTSLTGIPGSKANAIDICRDTVTGPDCTTASGYDLSVLTPTYIVSIPIDETEESPILSGFRLYANGTILKVCSRILDSECGS